MISFEMPEEIRERVDLVCGVARELMRPAARQFDEREHEIPWDFVNAMWDLSLKTGQSFRSGTRRDGGGVAAQALVHVIETLSWGDAGIYLCGPGAGLGGAAIEATGTAEQKQRFLTRYREGPPKWACMAMTEPHCGSDTAAIRTTAVRDGESWVLNGEKIFVTTGHKALVDSEGLMVVWATIDPAAGRAGMKPFVVEAGTPGVRVTKLERKMGIRASDTASVVLENCRIPATNLLGSAEVSDPRKGFKGAMATFDATRPSVAASALGIARATVELLKELLALQGIEVRYDRPRHLLTAVERDLLDMETQLRAAWLLTLKAAWMMDVAGNKSAKSEIAMIKVVAPTMALQVIDWAMQAHGGGGVCGDFPLAGFYAGARTLRFADGPDEVHRNAIAKLELSKHLPAPKR